MKRTVLAICVLLCLPASGASRLSIYLKGEWDYAMKEFPEWATSVGWPTGHDRWTDVSMEAIARRKRHTRDALKRLQAIPKRGLSARERLDYELYERELKLDLEGQRFPDEFLALSQMEGVHQQAVETVAVMPAERPKDFENILGRLDKVPALVDQHIALLREGVKKGIVPPRITLRDVLAQIDSQRETDPEKHALLAPFRTEAGKPYRARAEAVLKEKIVPAYTRFRKFFLEDYLPATRETVGLSALPQGKEWYAFRAKRSTTTDLTPKQIHEIGLSEVKRIRAEMEKAKAAAGFKDSLGAFFEFLRSEDKFFFEKPEELITAYRDIAKRADQELPKLFGKLPRLPYGVQPVPSYSEKSSPTAYYRPGSPQAGRAGVFFANTYDLKSRPKWEMEALTLHEAVPGHHLQIALAQESGELPEFRRHGGYTAFVEGWGLYAESLGERMGFYKDPYAKMGQLTYEMWRAVRLVVDTGLHELGWSRDQAIAFFEQNTGKARHDVIVEVDRYIVWPGQALAYKIGELKIKELVAEARRVKGDAFDIRQFHDALLAEGALPLDVLERRLRAWLGSKKAG